VRNVTRLYAGNPVNRAVLDLSSDNQTRADNQQGRLGSNI